MKVVKVKNAKSNSAGCCDCFGGGCRCNDEEFRLGRG